ncbi:MAG: 1-(5-phosphoribosyl)-5-[(5-phosphoribosylamino)methylideneamino]imidazole-4-carboxamide isomerase [Verrucomicrobia bacterium]|nr:1-(5-phosphoribosyl)-5-[(5-phosphoribosylamino)methylideneamino]imidazole-4-carboxamide isomerase [Verrucomicrobiota bacterium]MBU4430046.1 1-(5-phosphoribosyl)-5-[(5-phosphoribosylamino)methylideneamino]imidazole-4-carboxamide isomerase [Verrucomicrobiota bacterium]MCG2681127.1 1-(5-phosphoribosyl)-5-[(5-phosphoribosylamino)methylideneamino]imidazole-4-carboxamide isomerase [Kiritimatiellia bacterium]
MFTVIPAVDIRGGRCVRLHQGRAEEETVYAEDPVLTACQWEQQGAAWLHVVDLDGAFAGHPVHTKLMERMIRSVSIPVEVGGGLRSDDDLQRLVAAGAARVILGTRACGDADGLDKLIARFGDRLAVGIDARQGRVQVKGWTETMPLDALTLAARMDRQGIHTLIVTDTAVDGTLQGPNLSAIQAICDRVSCEVIASGGISSVADMAALCRLNRPNLTGAIVGKALYEGAVTLKALQAACRADGESSVAIT